MNPRIVVAFVLLYATWSSTFLGIRFAVQTIPPGIVGMFRHLGAGLILFVICLVLKQPKFRRREWLMALLVGAITNGLSNGCLILAEVTVPSSLAAVAFTTMPLFMILLNWRFFEKVVPHWMDGVAIVAGISGTAIALSVTDDVRGVSLQLVEGIILFACPFFWALGSLIGRRLTLPKEILVSASLQMIGGGLFLLVASCLRSEWGHFQVESVSRASWIGVLYLLFLGSLVGYTAFAYLIKRVDSRLVGTYAFVNPTIAFLLAAAAGERVLNGSMIAGATLAISSAMILFFRAYFEGRRAKAAKQVVSPELKSN